MLKLNDLTPINLASEKEKFFASNFKYNPQFIYEREISKEELLKYGKPKIWYLILAKIILNKYKKFRNNSSAKESVAQEILTNKEIQEFFIKHLSQYGLEHDYKIVFSKGFVSRVAVNLKNKEIKILETIKISKEEIEAILAHEIDTHLLRQYNYEQQVWFRQKNKFGFKEHLRTEEGLAVINEMISKNQVLAYKAAANYLAIDLAIKKDFVTVFNFFYELWQDSERAWIWTLKKKRGITDTSQKGAYTKDLVYFEGLMEVLRYLKKNNFDPSELYYGKINLKDTKKAKKLSLKHNLVLPKFFVQNQEAYKKAVLEIIKNNWTLKQSIID